MTSSKNPMEELRQLCRDKAPLSFERIIRRRKKSLISGRPAPSSSDEIVALYVGENDELKTIADHD